MSLRMIWRAPAEDEERAFPPSWRDPVARAATEVIGGPVGRYAAWVRPGMVAPWRPLAASLVATATVLMAGGALAKSHCFRVGWNTPDQFWHACYSDLPVVYRSSGLAEGAMPLLGAAAERAMDQPVLSTLSMWAVSVLTPDGSVLSQQRWYFAIWAAVLTLALAALVVVTVRSCPRSPWDAAHVALSPVVVTAALLSVDLLAVALTSVGLWAWGRGRVVPAGILFGVAVATRSYPLVVLAALGLLAMRAGRLAVWGRLAGTALGTLAVIVLPWTALSGSAVLRPYGAWWSAPAGYGSPWMVPELLEQAPRWMLPVLVGHPLPTWLVTALALSGWVLALTLGAVLALTPARRPTVAELSLVMLAIVLVTGKAVPIQAGLWVLPFIALCGLRWRDHLIWAGVEVASFVAVWLYIAAASTPDRGLPGHVYAMFVVARILAILYLAVLVWRRAAHRPAFAGPGYSEPRDPGEPDDPGGTDLAESPDVVPEGADDIDDLAGPLRGAPDRLLVRFT